jgi:hypothetical protein
LQPGTSSQKMSDSDTSGPAKSGKQNEKVKFYYLLFNSLKLFYALRYIEIKMFYLWLHYLQIIKVHDIAKIYNCAIISLFITLKIGPWYGYYIPAS